MMTLKEKTSNNVIKTSKSYKKCKACHYLHMLKCSISKYFFAGSLIILLFILFYTLVALNTCLYGNLKKIINKYGKDSNSLNPLSYIHELSIQDTETAVRVVPLSWQNDFIIRDNSTDGSPKYRFLRQQGLTPYKKLPDALIIGVKKGGTRALLEFVRLHPDVRAAGSEIHFFDKYYWKGLPWYISCMPATLEGQVTMEKTPSYFITREVPHRVHKMNPTTRLVVVVRDPVTRAVSDYTQAVSKKPELKSFEELAFPNGTDGIVNISWGPVKIGVYAKHLEKWFHYFPLSQFLFVSGERLIIDPAAEMARLQDFLGLKQVITEKYFYFNSTKGFPCLLKSEGHSNPRCLGKTKGRNHPHIEPYALQRLRNFYKPFNEKFYEMTGINFGWP